MASTLNVATCYRSLLNNHLKVVAMPAPPHFMFYCNGSSMTKLIEDDTNVHKCNMTYGGAMWNFLELVKAATNVTFFIHFFDPLESGGTCYSKDNCTGMISMVNQRVVDFSVGIHMNDIFMSYITETTSEKIYL